MRIRQIEKTNIQQHNKYTKNLATVIIKIHAAEGAFTVDVGYEFRITLKEEKMTEVKSFPLMTNK